jgi:hypothetical protein
VLAGVKALRSASTRRAAGFGLDPGSAQTTSSTYRRLSDCLALDSLVVIASSHRRPPTRHRVGHGGDQHSVTNAIHLRVPVAHQRETSLCINSHSATCRFRCPSRDRENRNRQLLRTGRSLEVTPTFGVPLRGVQLLELAPLAFLLARSHFSVSLGSRGFSSTQIAQTVTAVGRRRGRVERCPPCGCARGAISVLSTILAFPGRLS